MSNTMHAWRVQGRLVPILSFAVSVSVLSFASLVQAESLPTTLATDRNESPLLTLEDMRFPTAAGDFDGNGEADIVARTGASQVGFHVFSPIGEIIQTLPSHGNPPDGIRSGVDVNFDGVPDVLTSFFGRIISGATGELIYNGGARSVDFVGEMADGRVSVAFGDPVRENPAEVNTGVVELRNGDDGSLRCEIYGEFINGRFGEEVRKFTDVNADGIADIAVHQRKLIGPLSHEVFIISSADCSIEYSVLLPVVKHIDVLDDVNDDNVADFVIAHEFGTDHPIGVYSGVDGALIYTVADSISIGGRPTNAGDYNGDGYSDFIVGNPLAGPNRVGAVYVYSGTDGELLRLYFDPAPTTYQFSGQEVNGVGDINGDGFDDIAYLIKEIPFNGAHDNLVFAGGPGKTVSTLLGDFNHDGVVSLADAVSTLNFVFNIVGSDYPVLLIEADSNEDGFVDVADAIFTLEALF